MVRWARRTDHGPTCHHAEPRPTWHQAAAAIGRAFTHSEHHRCPQLTHTNCSTVSPVGTSIAVSTRSAPSHVLHRTNSVSIDQRVLPNRIRCLSKFAHVKLAARGPRRKWRLIWNNDIRQFRTRIVTEQLPHQGSSKALLSLPFITICYHAATRTEQPSPIWRSG